MIIAGIEPLNYYLMRDIQGGNKTCSTILLIYAIFCSQLIPTPRAGKLP
jgi:hypothetical protein